MENDSNQKGVLSVDETARYLGLSRLTVYSAVKRNEFPHVKVGRRILIPKGALSRLLSQATQKLLSE